MKPLNGPQDVPGAYHEDQLYLLTLCLELQLDLLLVALRSPEATRPGARGAGPVPRWVGDTLDLTDDALDAGPGVPSAVPETPGHDRAWLAGRYAALADAIDEMLVNGEVRKNPAVMARLVQARSTCGERLATLPTGAPAASEAVNPARVEAGHYLG